MDLRRTVEAAQARSPRHAHNTPKFFGFFLQI